MFFGGEGNWPCRNLQPFRFIYEFGIYPAWILAGIGCLAWIRGLLVDNDLAKRGFFCMMVILLGPGLLINGILKPHMHRPRPCQIAAFQGPAEYQPVLSIGPKYTNIVCRSFPSGHASMGFSLMAFPLIIRRRRSLFCAGMGLALGVGVLIGITRIVQGRHYPSDVLWSAAIVYLVAVVLYYSLGLHRTDCETSRQRRFDTEGRLVSVPYGDDAVDTQNTPLTLPGRPSRKIAA